VAYRGPDSPSLSGWGLLTLTFRNTDKTLTFGNTPLSPSKPFAGSLITHTESFCLLPVPLTRTRHGVSVLVCGGDSGSKQKETMNMTPIKRIARMTTIRTIDTELANACKDSSKARLLTQAKAMGLTLEQFGDCVYDAFAVLKDADPVVGA